MAISILRSQDCLKPQFGPRCLNSSAPISIPNPNPRFINNNNNNNNNQAFRCRRRKRSPAEGNRSHRRSDCQSTSPPTKKAGLVMGKVKILKRGEDIKPKMFSDGFDLVIDPIGPDPETLKREIRVPSDLYAGLSSPDPSSLPFPSGLVRRTVNAAETDLKKLLKI